MSARERPARAPLRAARRRAPAVLLGLALACVTDAPAPLTEDATELDSSAGDQDAGPALPLDLGLLDAAAGSEHEAGVEVPDAREATDAEPSDAGFDCTRCAEDFRNRACVHDLSECGCTRDAHCAGAEVCDVSTLRCVACAGSDCWRSALYPADWRPGLGDSEGRQLPDFSYAGYGAGARSIPDLAGPVFDVTDFGSGPDWRAAIQAAIDEATQQGGGVVFLPAGSYRVDGPLAIRAGGIVLRGAGVERTRLYFSTSAGMSDRAHLQVGLDPAYGAESLLRTDGEDRGTLLELEDASSLAPGDRVAVGWLISEPFRSEHGMEAHWGFAAGLWRPFFQRTVVRVHTSTPGQHRVELDVPLRYRARVRDGASLRPVLGLLTEVGIEDLSVSNAVELGAARSENRNSLIALRGVEDAWVRRVRSFASPLGGPASGVYHVQSHGISVINARRVTLEDLSLGRAQNRGSGGNGYLLELSRSNEVLVQRAVLRDGRHNFSFNWDFGNSGIVVRDSDSEGSTCDGALVACRSEFHHSLAMAVLIENTRVADGWVGGNRRAESSGAGHTVTGSVYWRLHGGERLYSWQYGHGYLVGNDLTEQVTELADTGAAGWELQWYPYWALNSNGHTSLATEPEDWVEGAGARAGLRPSSLYLDQLDRRLSRE